MLNRSQLADALKCDNGHGDCGKCTVKEICEDKGVWESVYETAIHYLTLSERQTKVLESAKELLGDALTDYPVSLGYRAVVIKVITAIEELSDNG